MFWNFSAEIEEEREHVVVYFNYLIFFYSFNLNYVFISKKVLISQITH